MLSLFSKSNIFSFQRTAAYSRRPTSFRNWRASLQKQS